jgi:hypothetical protein
MELYNRTREYNKIYYSYLNLKSINTELVNSVLNDSRTIIFEFTEKPSSSFFKQLEDEILKNKANIGLRLYGYDGIWKDLGFLTQLGSLKRLRIEESELETLSSISELEDLRYFSLEKSYKRLSIRPLEKFLNLQELTIEGEKKEIEVVSKLVNLKKLSLLSYQKADMSIFKNLNNLEKFLVSGGSIENHEHISTFTNLKYLFLNNLKQINDIDFVVYLKSLVFLYLGRFLNLRELPEFRNCENLKKIEIEHCNKIVNLESILTANELEEFRWTSNKISNPENFLFLSNAPKLKYLYVNSFKATDFKVFEDYIGKHNKIFTPIPSGKFEYLTM